MIPILFWSQLTIDVRLHGTHTDYLFSGRSPNGTARVIATIGITHGRKAISPSSNPCDSDPFLVQLTIDVRLHGTHTNYLFSGQSPNGTARVIATIGITHGRKTVSPSRNPYDSDPFLVATHNRCSPSWDPHRLLFFGPESEWNRINWDLPPSVGLLLTVRTRFFCTRDRV